MPHSWLQRGCCLCIPLFPKDQFFLSESFFLGYFSWRGVFLENKLKYYNLYQKTKKSFKININGKIKSIQKLYLESSNLFAINKKKVYKFTCNYNMKPTRLEFQDICNMTKKYWKWQLFLHSIFLLNTSYRTFSWNKNFKCQEIDYNLIWCKNWWKT